MSAGPSAALFPKTIDPLKMVDQRVDLEGKIALAQLDRLQEALLDTEGDVDVSLHFSKDEEGIPRITGSVQAEVVLQCQRCLQPVTFQLASAVNLGIVFSEDGAKNLPGYYDPLLLDTPEVQVRQMVEEELILSLPIAAMHAPGECQVAVSYGEEVAPDRSERPNPFQILEQLKDDK